MLLTLITLLGLFLLPVCSVFGFWGCWLWLLPPTEIPCPTRSSSTGFFFCQLLAEVSARLLARFYSAFLSIFKI